jgi:hypothetical protein
MKFWNQRSLLIAALAALCLCLSPTFAQTKPLESTTKIKKVLLYNKIGGWIADSGISAVQSTFSKLATDYDFDLAQLDEDSVITLDYLKQFQVIVWNNNTHGAASIPSSSARNLRVFFPS